VTQERPRFAVIRSIFEALSWIFVYHLSQGLVLIFFLSLLMLAAFGFEWPGQDQVVQMALDLDLDRSFLLVGVTNLGALFLIVPMVRWRLGRQFRDAIGARLPTRQELVFAIATIAPIAILGDATYEITRNFFAAAGPSTVPFASAVHPSSLEYLHQTFSGVPYPILIVAMALGPAVGEELIFRGMIGRRLVTRWGPYWGTFFAAAVFSAAHISPAHAIATFPVAVLLQLLYLQTKTIWVPILVHFGNNLLAVTMVRYQIVPEIPMSPMLLFGICVYLGLILMVLDSHRRCRELPTLSLTGMELGLK